MMQTNRLSSNLAGRPVRIVLLAAATFVVASVGTYVAQRHDMPVTAVLIYLTGVIMIGALSGIRLGILAALAASFIYNFFISEPAFRFALTSADELVPLVAFNLSAIISGGLAGRLKDSERAARLAEAHSAFLLRVSDRLQQSVKLQDVTLRAREAFPADGVKDLEIFVVRGNQLYALETDGETVPVLPLEAIVALTDGTTRGDFCAFELNGSGGQLGLVKFLLDRKAGAGDAFLPDLQGVANLLSLAVDRCMLLERLSETRALQRSEELKSAIISSVSHDLRTPLTAIEAAASSLRSFSGSLPVQQREELLSTIEEQCQRLNQYTANLLDMGRIQAGISPSQFDDVDVLDIVGVVLGNIRLNFPHQKIEKHFALTSALVRANPAMLEQAIFNIVENALIHGQSIDPLELNIHGEGKYCNIEIFDRGPGIAKSDQPHIFERFYRSEQPQNRRGSGLGLYIADGFVRAFGGAMAVVSPVDERGGTRMIIRLPLISDEPEAEAAL